MTDIFFQVEALDSPAGARLVAAFAEEIASLYPGWDPNIGPSAQPQEFVPPRGTFLIGYLDGDAVACGGVKVLGNGVAEIKRIYVAPHVRGRGVARRLLDGLEQAALELGCPTVRLDTGNNQPDAFALFSSAGYESIDDYNANPYASYWFEKAVG